MTKVVDSHELLINLHWSVLNTAPVADARIVDDDVNTPKQSQGLLSLLGQSTQILQVQGQYGRFVVFFHWLDLKNQKQDDCKSFPVFM